MATALRTADEITRDIDALGAALQDPHLNVAQRCGIKAQINALRVKLVTAVEQEEITAAEHAVWGRPERYL